MSYQAFVCKLQNVRSHSNADRIKLATVYGTQIVVGLDNVDGEIGVYFPPDGQLTGPFCSENNLFRHSHLNIDTDKSGYFEDSARIKAQKFRGEESDGFWLPISCLDFLGDHKLKEGDAFDTVAGTKICQKYITAKTRKQQANQNKTALSKDSFPFFKQHTDTKQLSYFAREIPDGGYCIFTEKLHGTSGRTSNTRIPQKPWLFGKWFARAAKYEYVSGSRRVILNFRREMDEGFYGTNLFRKEIHDCLVTHLFKGETIFYEIVGWVNKERPIMNTVDNKKLQDKKFLKKYGEQTTFTYGCNPGEYDIYVYRMTMTNPDGYIVEYSWDQICKRCSVMGLKTVPLLHKFMFYKGSSDDRTNTEELINRVTAYISSEDQLPASSILDDSHIAEGVVLRIEKGNEFAAYKYKGFHFKVLEGIIKDTGVEDIEEGS
jgi:hypothetical protein